MWITHRHLCALRFVRFGRGLFPTAYSLGGSDPLLIPITLALAWGLGFGTFGSLIFVPAAFSAYSDLLDRLTRLWNNATQARKGKPDADADSDPDLDPGIQESFPTPFAEAAQE